MRPPPTRSRLPRRPPPMPRARVSSAHQGSSFASSSTRSRDRARCRDRSRGALRGSFATRSVSGTSGSSPGATSGVSSSGSATLACSAAPLWILFRTDIPGLSRMRDLVVRSDFGLHTVAVTHWRTSPLVGIAAALAPKPLEPKNSSSGSAISGIGAGGVSLHLLRALPPKANQPPVKNRLREFERSMNRPEVSGTSPDVTDPGRTATKSVRIVTESGRSTTFSSRRR